MNTRTIALPESLVRRIEDVAKASEASLEETAQSFLEAMLQAWEPHLVKDGQGGVMDIFREESELWAEESARSGGAPSEEGEGWKQG